MLPARRLIALLLWPSLLSAATLQQPAPPLTLRTSRNDTVSLSDLKGNVVLINFWASWCAPCRTELPELNRLAEEFKGKKVRILAINVDEDPVLARKVLTELHLSKPSLTVLFDHKTRTVSAYAIETMPSSFIVDQKGIIRFQHQGFRHSDPVIWRQEITSLNLDLR